jgi:fatty acid synthase
MIHTLKLNICLYSIVGSGYVRSEAVVAVYIQKMSKARRAYASILHIKTNTDGFKNNGITFPSAVVQEELLTETLDEAKMDRSKVTYVECHGTGTQAGDPEEFIALHRTFAKSLEKREKPLYVGSTKSNMGHSEGASGLCSLAKVVIMCQDGVIPANLHYKTPHYNMRAIRNGQIQVRHSMLMFKK